MVGGIVDHVENARACECFLARARYRLQTLEHPPVRRRRRCEVGEAKNCPTTYLIGATPRSHELHFEVFVKATFFCHSLS